MINNKCKTINISVVETTNKRCKRLASIDDTCRETAGERLDTHVSRVLLCSRRAQYTTIIISVMETTNKRCKRLASINDTCCETEGERPSTVLKDVASISA